MKHNKQISALLLIAFTLLFSSCGSSEKSESNEAFNPVGEWNYKVTTDVSYGVITIKKEAETYTASMTTEVFGTLTLMNLKIDGKKLTADLDVAGSPAKIYCNFSGGGEMTGAVQTSDTKFPFIGDRKSH